MALQYVGSTSGAGTSSGYTVSLNGTLTGGIASSPAEGDLVVVFSAFGNTASSAPAISGNTSGAYIGATAAQHVNDTWDTEFRSFYQMMGATPDTTLTVTRATNAAYGGATIAHVWRGVHPTTPFIGAATPASAGNTSIINPPAYDPAVTGCLIIAGGAGTQATTGAAFTAFTGMSNFKTQKGDGSTSDIDVAIASYAYADVSYDPPAVSGGTGGNASSSWAGVTLAFRPFNYALTCTKGGYTYSGQSVGVSRNRTLTASNGSYAYSGQNANLTYTPLAVGYTLTAQNGSYSYSGQSANLVKGRVLTATNGSYLLSGQTAGVLRSKNIVAQNGSYTLNGQTAIVLRNKWLTSQNGSYSYSGQSAALVRGRVLTAQVGSYSLNGQSVGITYTPSAVGYTLTTQAGSYSVTGQSASLLKSKRLVADAGSYAQSGQDAGILFGRRLATTAGSYAYTGQSSSYHIAYIYPPAQYVMSGVIYGPTGTEYTGTYADTGLKLDLETSRLFKPLTSSIGVLL